MVNKRQTTKAKTGLTPPRSQNNTNNNKNTKNNTNNKDNTKELITAATGFAVGSDKKQTPSAATATASTVTRAGGKRLAWTLSKELDTAHSIWRYLTPSAEEDKQTGSSLEHIIESDEEMEEQEEEKHKNEDNVDEGNVSTQPPVIEQTVIDLIKMVMDLESVTPTQEPVNIISPGEHIMLHIATKFN
jgi:hypothetical protein